ncbi:hypothetical protein BP00DRAFT_28931 [Aspergillus indologenus CBS 114.80]|uniref:Uncharacterized protein n=1 Tax=Aspergillus indologenus CBS 114.80 TaxID=1450541 RepID=A0A2V5I046_9EURO|nr:hypothetical protein BP00DRAFT_28931 [Aspergillus indologenus CBS 114.80]
MLSKHWVPCTCFWQDTLIYARAFCKAAHVCCIWLSFLDVLHLFFFLSPSILHCLFTLLHLLLFSYPTHRLAIDFG